MEVKVDQSNTAPAWEVSGDCSHFHGTVATKDKQRHPVTERLLDAAGCRLGYRNDCREVLREPIGSVWTPAPDRSVAVVRHLDPSALQPFDEPRRSQRLWRLFLARRERLSAGWYSDERQWFRHVLSPLMTTVQPACSNPALETIHT